MRTFLEAYNNSKSSRDHWANGGQIQYRYMTTEGCWEEWHDYLNLTLPQFCHPAIQWRVKPRLPVSVYALWSDERSDFHYHSPNKMAIWTWPLRELAEKFLRDGCYLRGDWRIIKFNLAPDDEG